MERNTNKIIDRANKETMANLDAVLTTNRVKRTLLRAYAIGFVAGAAALALVMFFGQMWG
jgi:hypothetical protein